MSGSNDERDAASILMEAVKIATKEVHAAWIKTAIGITVAMIVYTVCLTRYLEKTVESSHNRLEFRFNQLSNELRDLSVHQTVNLHQPPDDPREKLARDILTKQGKI